MAAEVPALSVRKHWPNVNSTAHTSVWPQSPYSITGAEGGRFCTGQNVYLKGVRLYLTEKGSEVWKLEATDNCEACKRDYCRARLLFSAYWGRAPRSWFCPQVLGSRDGHVLCSSATYWLKELRRANGGTVLPF